MEADRLQRKLKDIHRLSHKMMIAGAVAGGGAVGLGIMGHMMEPAKEYIHQLNIMNMAGLKHQAMAEATADAWKNTGRVMTTSVTENLRSLLDLRNVLGNMEEAKMALPIISRIQAVLAASSEGQIRGNSKDLAYSMAKALDIIGAAQNKKMFDKQAEMMAKVIIATQGRVTPEAFKSAFQYARQAKYRLSNQFKYEILPTLIQENATMHGGGGGSRGVGPMMAAFYRWSNQGYINRKALPALISLGLVKPSTALQTTTSGTTVGAMKDADLAAANPFLWVQKVLVPALQRKYGHMTKDQLMKHVGEITRGNQLASNLIAEFAYKPVNFTRDQRNIRGTLSTTEAYRLALSHDPNTIQKAFGAQWENFKTAFTVSLVPVLVKVLGTLANGLNHLATWMHKNAGAAKAMAYGLTALFTAMLVGGSIRMLTFAFKGLGMVLEGGSIAASLTGLGGALGTIGKVSTTLVATLSKAVPVLLAAYAGWKAGSYIYKHSIKGTKADHTIGKGIASVLAFFGDSEAQKGLRFEHEHEIYRSRHMNGGHGNKAGDVFLDGKRVGKVIAKHMGEAASKAPPGPTSRMDPSLGLPALGAPSFAVTK